MRTLLVAVSMLAIATVAFAEDCKVVKASDDNYKIFVYRDAVDEKDQPVKVQVAKGQMTKKQIDQKISAMQAELALWQDIKSKMVE